MTNNFHHQLDNNKISKDLLKSILTHGLIFISIIVVGFIQNKTIFSDINPIQNTINNESQHRNIYKNIVQANLIDGDMVQQALKRQELQAADKIIREKKIQQQEKNLAQLTKMAEQEMLKAKQEALKAKQDREQLKKEQESLQQTANKLKNQAKELSSQQEKLDKLKAQQAQKKKLEATPLAATSTNQKTTDVNHSSTSATMQSTIQTETSNYQSKWRAEIINNRKKTMFFPEHLVCSIKIKIMPDGNLALVKIEKSSGNMAYDSFSEQAIYKSAPFDMPVDPLVNQKLVEAEYMFKFDDSTFNND